MVAAVRFVAESAIGGAGLKVGFHLPLHLWLPLFLLSKMVWLHCLKEPQCQPKHFKNTQLQSLHPQTASNAPSVHVLLTQPPGQQQIKPYNRSRQKEALGYTPRAFGVSTAFYGPGIAILIVQVSPHKPSVFVDLLYKVGQQVHGAFVAVHFLDQHPSG